MGGGPEGHRGNGARRRGDPGRRTMPRLSPLPMRPLPTVQARRYVAPLREGGSLPAVVEDESGARWVTKFLGAGQGARALVAELVVGRLADALGLPIPALALVDADERFGRAEPDPEIQDILRGSHGLNVGLGYLEHAFGYDPVADADLVAPDLAADVAWLDALTFNVDRTPRNPNLLVTAAPGGPALWLIDHGAALYLHHDWPGVTPERARSPFAPLRQHVLLPRAASLADADARLAPRVTEALLREIVAAVPDDMLMHAPEGQAPAFETPEANRAAYIGLLSARLEGPRAWVEAAEAVRGEVQAESGTTLDYRR